MLEKLKTLPDKEKQFVINTIDAILFGRTIDEGLLDELIATMAEAGCTEAELKTFYKGIL